MILDLKNPGVGREGWSPAPPETTAPPPDTQPPTTTCPLCSKEFYSSYFLAQHMEESHREREEEEGVLEGGGGLLSGGKSEKRPSPSLSRSYCTICHKELCNKYFMRTHMLKMHGISIESSTGLGGVTCDICNKELCSKYFLKVHKQNTHGISDLPTSPSTPVPLSPPPPPTDTQQKNHPAPPAPPKRSGGGSGKKRGGKGRNGNNGPKEESLSLTSDPLGLLLGKMEGGGKRVYRCAYCPFNTPLLVYLIAHEKTHVGLRLPPSPSLQCPLCFLGFPGLEPFQHHLASAHGISTLPAPPAPAFGGGKEEGGQRKVRGRRSVFRCSACALGFRSGEACRAHIKTAHAPRRRRVRKGWPCPKCKFRGGTYARLWLHARRNHPRHSTVSTILLQFASTQLLTPLLSLMAGRYFLRIEVGKLF
jgi:hypothetical protein